MRDRSCSSERATSEWDSGRVELREARRRSDGGVSSSARMTGLTPLRREKARFGIVSGSGWDGRMAAYEHELTVEFKLATLRAGYNNCDLLRTMSVILFAWIMS